MTIWEERTWVGADIEDFQSLAHERGWGDGLPLIPPTPSRVEAMLGGSRSRADDST